MNYQEMSRNELIGVLNTVASALGGDIADPLCMNIEERAKRLMEDFRLTAAKYHLLMVDHSISFGIEGAGLLRAALSIDVREAEEGLRVDFGRIKSAAKIRLERAVQLSLAEAQQAAQEKAFEAMIAARKADEICRGVSADIMTAAGFEIRKD